MSAIPLPQIEGKYEILLKIREGGMGAIYKVRHLLLDEIRVIKVIRPQLADSADMQRRFHREARAATRLKHPNIAQLHDFSVNADGSAYMVMEFIDGVTLQEMLESSGPAPLDLTLEIARQGLTALRYLHQQGYVHRDISPDNLMLAKDVDGMPLVKLIDLGIVKHLEGDGDQLTGAGLYLGKVRYSAPEQFAGEGAVLSNRSDLYSFGVMLYELLTGTYPIQGDNLSQLVAAHLFRPPLSFDTTDPTGRVPREIREVVLRALEKDAANRISSADEFLELLSRPALAETLIVDLQQTLSTTTSMLDRGDEVPRPGSTQRRFDEEFGLVRTPSQPAGLRATDPIEVESEEALIATLLTNARQLAAERDWEEARRRLLRALVVDRHHVEARGLLASVESSLKQSIEEEKVRQQGLAQAVERVGRHLANERVDEAARELADARAHYGEDFLLSGLESQIAATRRVATEHARMGNEAAGPHVADAPAGPVQRRPILSSRMAMASAGVLVLGGLGGLLYVAPSIIGAGEAGRDASARPAEATAAHRQGAAAETSSSLESAPVGRSASGIEAAQAEAEPAAAVEADPSVASKRVPEPLGPTLLACGAAGVVCAKAVSVPTPSYPQAARRRGLVGDVEIAVLVDETGRVVQATLLKRASLQAFNDAALAAARSALFAPATSNGVAGRTWTKLTYHFAPP